MESKVTYLDSESKNLYEKELLVYIITQTNVKDNFVWHYCHSFVISRYMKSLNNANWEGVEIADYWRRLTQ